MPRTPGLWTILCLAIWFLPLFDLWVIAVTNWKDLCDLFDLETEKHKEKKLTDMEEGVSK